MEKLPFKVHDLTHTIDGNIATWEGDCGFKSKNKVDYEDNEPPARFRVQSIEMIAGIGTHMDVPAHVVPGGVTVEQLELEQLIVPCVVIDVSSRADEKYLVSAADIQGYEREFGRIAAGSVAMFHTGWDRHWSSPEKYRNRQVFPSVAKEAAELLLERDIRGLGIDTLSPDLPGDFPVHRLVLGAGRYLIENAANLAAVPPKGAYLLALPTKIKNATEAPLRLVALV